MDNGFLAKGQKLGNMFKWKNIQNTMSYEQSADSKAISEANSRTRARFADLLSQGDERDQNRGGRFDDRAKDDHTESANHSRGNQITQCTERRGDKSESSGIPSGALGNEA